MGASGSGTTTLAAQLSKRLAYLHLDADDFYWKPTDPPYQEKISPEVRRTNLQQAFEASANVIISGSLVSWGDYWTSAFDAAVFITIDPKIRMERLIQRERDRYGDKLSTDPVIRENHRNFIKWAAQYDDPTFEGRSITLHKKWLATVRFPVWPLDGAMSTSDQCAAIRQNLEQFASQ